MKNKIILSVLIIFVLTIGITFAYTPKIMIESYKFEDGKPTAGENNTLSIILKNTSKDYSIRNLSIIFNSNEKSEKRYITTYESSNIFYIRKIKIDDTSELKIPIFIDSEIPSGVHEIPIKFVYEDVNKRTYEQTHLISVPVSVPKKLDISEIIVPEEVVQGEEFNIQLRLFNESKSNIENVKLNLESQGKSYEKEIRVGKIEQGETEYVDFKVYSDKIGDLKGKVTIVFEDEWNKKHEQTKEFSTKVIEQVITKEEVTNKTNYTPYIIGIVAFVFVYFIYLVLKKRKNNKKNKELELDE